jgi:hypothetical protein
MGAVKSVKEVADRFYHSIVKRRFLRRRDFMWPTPLFVRQRH